MTTSPSQYQSHQETAPPYEVKPSFDSFVQNSLPSPSETEYRGAPDHIQSESRSKPKELRLAARALSRQPKYTVLEDAEKGPEAHVQEDTQPFSPQQQPLPGKKYSRWSRNLRWTFLNVYERLSIIVLVPNLVMMIFLIVQPNTFDHPDKFSTPVAVNILVSVLIRQEDVINLLFWSFGKTPKSLPLRIRRAIAKLYHLGGIHSGCGIAAVLWFLMFNAAIAKMMSNEDYKGIRMGSFFITMLLDMLLVSILIMSLPKLRARYHNMWEQIHRFAGWLAVFLFWLHLFLFSAVQARDDSERSLIEVLFHSPTFYCLLVTTIALVMPWLRLKKVPVRAEAFSDHAVRLHFTYTNLAVCTTPRFSDHPMKEWHAFAAIPAADGIGYSVMVSKAGDWTTKLIKNPPKELWTKGTPARGALYMAQVFRRVILVATGSGIAPILGLLTAPGLDCRIFWSTPDPANVFAPYIIDVLKASDPNAVIWDTRKLGRPNLVEEVYKMYTTSDAEAVFIISNAAVTRKFVYGLESRGVPTFAPIFDS